MKRFSRVFFYLVPLLLITAGLFSPAKAAVTVDIVGPPGVTEVLANSRYTFLVYLSNSNLITDVSAADAALSVSITNGSFHSAIGTDAAHYDTLPAADDAPAVYLTTSALVDGASKIAAVTVDVGAAGTLIINAGSQYGVSGSLSLPITTSHGYADLQDVYYELAVARFDLTGRLITMYMNYMDSGNLYGAGADQQALGSELAGLCSLAGNIVRVTGLLTDLLTNPGVALYSGFLELVGEATGQPNLMDILAIIDIGITKTVKEWFHYGFNGDWILVQLDADKEAGLLDDYLDLLAGEALAWSLNRLTSAPEGSQTVFEALDLQEDKLDYIEAAARARASLAGSSYPGAMAFFSMIVDYAEQERKTLKNIRAQAALLANTPPACIDPAAPAAGATGVNIDTALLNWNCSDADNNPLIYDVYLKKSTDALYAKLTTSPISISSFSIVGRLEPATTYEWYVKATDTDIDDYAELGVTETSPVWTFATASTQSASVDYLSAPDNAETNKPITVKTGVTVRGYDNAQLQFKLNGSLLGSYTVNSSPEPQHFSLTFSQASAVSGGVLRVALLESDGVSLLDDASQTINITSAGSLWPYLVEIQLEGTGQSDTNYLYDSDPLIVTFLAVNGSSGALADVTCRMKYAFSETAPSDWSSITEVDLFYQGTQSHTVSGYAPFDVARLTRTIPTSEFGPQADGKKTLWIQHTEISDGLATVSGTTTVYNMAGHPIRDDDTMAPVVIFEGQVSSDDYAYMNLVPGFGDLPGKLEFSLYALDRKVWLENGVLEDDSDGFAEVRWGKAYSATEPAPGALADEVFSIENSIVNSTGNQVRFYDDFLTYDDYDREGEWLVVRVRATEWDNDWIGDGAVVRGDWIAQVPDDDTDGPLISEVTLPAYAEYNRQCNVSCTIWDASGLMTHMENDGNIGKDEARVYWSYDLSTWSGPLYPSSTSYDALDGRLATYGFSVPVQGSDHINKTLYFKIEATDNDRDRDNDAMTSVAHNAGQYYRVDIVDLDDPAVSSLNLADNDILEGNVTIDATVTDPSGTVTGLVKINGQIVADSLPFVWNTTIPSWSAPYTVVTGIDTWNNIAVAGGNGRELWLAYLSGGNIAVRHSPDGANWNAPVQAVTPQDTVIRPTLLRDSSSTLWLAFQDYDPFMSLFVSRSQDNGLTWSAPVAATSGIDVVGTNLYQDAGGTYWYSYYSYDENWNNVIQVISSSDGLNWSAPVTVDPNTDYTLDYALPVLGRSPDGAVHVFYRYTEWSAPLGMSIYTVMRSSSTDNGATWSTPVAVSLPRDPGDAQPLQIIQDPAGTSWLAYTAGGFTYMAPSSDLLVWDDPVVVDDTVFIHQVAQSGDGTFWAAGPRSTGIQILNSVVADSYLVTVEAVDAGGNTAAQEATVTVHVNDPPIADALTVNTSEDTPVAVTLSGSDPDGDPLTYGIINEPFNGTLAGTAPDLTYTPDLGYSGTDFFSYKVHDGTVYSAPVTVTVIVGSVNDPPTISGINNQTILEGSVSTAMAFTVADQETPAGDLVLSAVSSNTALVPNSSIFFGGAGGSRTVTATPAADQHGTTTITVTVSDGQLSASTSYILSVTSVNDAPAVSGQSLTTVQNIPLAITLAGSDVDGDSLSYTVVDGPAHGTLAGTPPDLVYTPAAGYTGLDSFTFRASDGMADSGLATVSILVIYLAGDMDESGAVDISDAILVTQVLAGMSPAGIRSDYASPGADVNNDARIGMEELLYIMQKLAGLR